MHMYAHILPNLKLLVKTKESILVSFETANALLNTLLEVFELCTTYLFIQAITTEAL